MPVGVENNTARIISLPPTESYHRGVKLLPGYNRVEDAYWEELTTYEVETEKKGKKPAAVRKPGLEQIEQLKQPVRIVSRDGVKVDAQITVYEADQVGRDEGPLPPQSLKGIKPEAAAALVNVTSDRAALKRWVAERSEFSNLAQAKLAGA